MPPPATSKSASSSGGGGASKPKRKKSERRVKGNESEVSTTTADEDEEDEEKEKTTGADVVVESMQRFFGHCSFRSKEQESAVRAVVKGANDVFVSMPTGSGKSLVYQLPGAMQARKVTIVVSPLLALIKAGSY